MADTAAGRALVEQHRQAQLRLRAEALARVVTLWPAFNLDDIDGSWPPLQAALSALVADRFRESASTADEFYENLRIAEDVPGDVESVPDEDPDTRLIRANLILLGPIGAKKNIASGMGDVEGRTLSRLSGGVARLALMGGRNRLVKLVRADRMSTGWRRVTDSSPCDWCQNQAGEPVSDKNFRSHDHCGCSAEPAFNNLP